MVQEQAFLKGQAGTFPVSFFQGLSFLHLEMTLPFTKLGYTSEEKIFFSATIILWKKVMLSCLKMNWKDPINWDNLFVKWFKRLKTVFDWKQQLNW